MPVALLGIGVSKGIAFGKARILQRGQLEILEYALPEHLVDEEIARFRRALDLARTQLRAVRERIPVQTPGEIAAFIDAHLLMLEDATLSTGPEQIIRTRRCNAEWALKLQKDALVQVFDEMDDPYLRTRQDDVEHVVRRVQQILLKHTDHHTAEAEAGKIILADDLSPAELVLLHHQKIAGLVTERGGFASHTAILARSLNIPAVVGVPHHTEYVREDETVVIDGREGVMLAALDDRTRVYYRRKQLEERRQRSALRKFRHTPAITRDNVPIELQANVDLPEDITAMKRAGVRSVGLFRTEFMFMNRSEMPDEQEQLTALRKVIRKLGGGPLTIRTLDFGQDKLPLAGLAAPGPNPALGLRAIRLCLKEADLFIPQIRAILRASAYGPVRILFPMLTTIQELEQVLELVSSVKRSLGARRYRFDPDIPIGAMIEVPAAALCADAFARRVDFLSIGTNDLIQYTLATDRMDQEVTHLYDPLHPAVLRLTKLVLEAGQRAGIPVSMCGEMAADPRVTRLLLGLGLTGFSMPPTAALEVKRIISQSHKAKLQSKVEQILGCDHPQRLAELVDQLNR